jgi:hypothetical protein
MPDDKIFAKADFIVFDTNHVPDTNRIKEVYSLFYYRSAEPGIVIYKSSRFEPSIPSE